MDWHLRARTCPLLCSSPYQHLTFKRGEAHVTGWGKEWTFQAVTQHIKPSVFGKARIQWTHLHWACPGLLVDASDQCSVSGKRNWNQAWRPACRPFCAICPQAPLEQEDTSLPPLCRGVPWSRATAKQSQQSRVRFLKFNSEDTIRQRKRRSFRAIAENLQGL